MNSIFGLDPAFDAYMLQSMEDAENEEEYENEEKYEDDDLND